MIGWYWPKGMICAWKLPDDMKHNRWRSLVALVVLAMLLLGCSPRIEAAQVHSTGEHVSEIAGDHTAGQTFVAEHDGLQSVDVLLATFARRNTEPVTFHLRREPASQDDLRTVIVPAADIADNAYHRFSFSPIAEAHHERFYFEIESPESRTDDAITAWIGPADDYRDGSLYVAGNAREGQLAFRLGYSLPYVGWGLLRDVVASLPAGLAAVALFVLPGLALILWLVPDCSWDGSLTVIVAAGVSAALFPVLFLLADLVGLRWGSSSVWVMLVFCAGLVLWHVRRQGASGRPAGKTWRGLFKRPAKETLVLWALAGVVLGVRWFVVRSLTIPMWGDSQQHTTIAQLMVDHGGLFDSWEPYSPYASFTAHFGFHAAAAFFHWTTGLDVPRSIVLVGQIFNVLAVLALVPLAVRVTAKSGHDSRAARWAGIFTVLVAGLLVPLPMQYVNWGRYPQLAGQAILPIALWLLWAMADHRGRGGWRLAVLAAISAAGMTLTYYRMPFYYAAFGLAWLLLYCLIEWRADRERWFSLCRRVVVMTLVLLALILPWAANLAGGQMAADLAKDAAVSTAVDQVVEDYRLWRGVDGYYGLPMLVGALIAGVWSVKGRQWSVTMIGLWAVFLAALPAVQLLPLPGVGFLNSFAILIALYMPVAILVGWLASDLAWSAAQGRENWVFAGAVAVLAFATIWGFRDRLRQLDVRHELVTRADEAAMAWIRDATPPDATFLVNGFLIYGGTSAVGSDAGWWIPLLGGRANTMPPQYALYNEAEIEPGYGQAVVELVATLEDSPPTTDRGLKAVCDFGVTHVYVGQGQGRVAAQELDPILKPAELAAHPAFDLLYHQDRVWIFALKDDACPQQ
jgi:hypothetical protein